MQPPPEVSPTLPEVAAAFARDRGRLRTGGKAAILRPLLERSDPTTVKGIVKVLGGDLRIGLREGLVEAAIAHAFDRPLDDVKWAGMLDRRRRPAREPRPRRRLGEAELTLFHPLKFMLASPAEDAAEIIRRLGPEVWVEDKYDGIRAQLHKRGPDVRLYSRDLHDVSTQFPEIVDAARTAAVGRHPRRRDPRLEGRPRPAVHLAPGAARAQGAIGRRSRPSAGHLRRLRCRWRSAPATTAPIEPLLREPLPSGGARLDALDLPLGGDGGRFARSHLAVARRRRRARGRVPRRPRAGATRA